MDTARLIMKRLFLAEDDPEQLRVYSRCRTLLKWHPAISISTHGLGLAEWHLEGLANMIRLM